MHPTCNSRSWRIQEPPSSLGQKLATSFQNAEHLTFVWIRFFFKHLPFSIENPILQPRFFSWIFHDFSRFFLVFLLPKWENPTEENGHAASACSVEGRWPWRFGRLSDWCDWCLDRGQVMPWFTLWETYKKLWKITIFHGKTMENYGKSPCY